MRSRLSTLCALAAAVFMAASCGDTGPTSAPGTVTAVIVSPNGQEGAAVVRLEGSGIENVSAASGDVYSRKDASGMTVVVINEPAGELAFHVALADTTVKPTATLQQVAAPNDALRVTLVGYTVEFRQ